MARTRRGKKRTALLTGVCSECGRRSRRNLMVWLFARHNEAWPSCRACGGRVYPKKRRCKKCAAVLRDGNFGSLCAPCQAKHLDALKLAMERLDQAIAERAAG